MKDYNKRISLSVDMLIDEGDSEATVAFGLVEKL